MMRRDGNPLPLAHAVGHRIPLARVIPDLGATGRGVGRKRRSIADDEIRQRRRGQGRGYPRTGVRGWGRGGGEGAHTGGGPEEARAAVHSVKCWCVCA